MRQPLLTLVALCSQALGLFGPGVVVCHDRYGRVGLEYVGRPCTACTPAPTESAGCGCCHHRDNPADPPPASVAVPTCDCEHVPLTVGTGPPCLGPDRATTDELHAVGPPPVVPGCRPLPALGHGGGYHDPPGSGRTAHLPLLAGIVLRC